MPYRWLPYQAGAMGGELSQRDRFSKRVLRLQLGDLVLNRRVQLEAALLQQLHEGDVGKEF